jgi:hypothetical protein
MIEGNERLQNFVPNVRFGQMQQITSVILNAVNSDSWSCCDCAKALQSQSLAGALLLKSPFHYFQPLQCLNLFLCGCLFIDVFGDFDN